MESENLKFSLRGEKLDEGPPEERVGYGRFVVSVGRKSLTQGYDRHSNQSRLLSGPLVSGYHVAEWLVANWWRLLWEPMEPPDPDGREWDFAHRMSAIGGGWDWPDISIGAHGSMTLLTSEPSCPDFPGSFRYTGAPPAVVPVASLESGIDRFAKEMLGRLNRAGLDDTNLHRLWDDLRSERDDPETARYRKIEALMGFDPDEGDEERIVGLAELADRSGEEAMRELAAGTMRTR